MKLVESQCLEVLKNWLEISLSRVVGLDSLQRSLFTPSYVDHPDQFFFLLAKPHWLDFFPIQVLVEDDEIDNHNSCRNIWTPGHSFAVTSKSQHLQFTIHYFCNHAFVLIFRRGVLIKFTDIFCMLCKEKNKSKTKPTQPTNQKNMKNQPTQKNKNKTKKDSSR